MDILRRPTPGDTVRVRDELWRVRAVERSRGCAAWALEGRGPTNGGTQTTLLTPFDELHTLEREPLQSVSWLAYYRALTDLRERCRGVNALEAPNRARVSLLPYQIEPALASVVGGHLRLLIADEVGMGKTLQAGLIVHELSLRHALRRALLVVPGGLVEQWETELARAFGLQVIRITWELLRRRQQRVPELHPWAHEGVGLVSLDFLRQPELRRGLEEVDWDVVIVDEAHHCVNRSRRADAVMLVAARSLRVVLLSATPHSGDGARFDALVAIGRHQVGVDELLVLRRTRSLPSGRARPRRKTLHVYAHETERHVVDLLARYARAVGRASRGRSGYAVRLAMLVLRKRACAGPWPLLQSVERRVRALSHLRVPAGTQAQLPFDTAADTDAPPFEAETVPSPMAPRHERAWLNAIAHAARAAVAHDAKCRALARLVSRTREPLIVFTEYRDALEHVLRVLRPLARVSVVHGGLTLEARHAALDTFRRGRSRVLLATDAASEGLNLHHRCRWVVHMELPWTPTRLEQRVGRVDRLGQDRTVHALCLVNPGLGEAMLLARLAQRASRIAAVLGPAATPVVLSGAETTGDAPSPARPTFSEAPATVVPTPQASPKEARGAAFCRLSYRRLRRRQMRMANGRPPEKDGPNQRLSPGFYYVVSAPILAGDAVVEEAAAVVHVTPAHAVWSMRGPLRPLAASIANACLSTFDSAVRARSDRQVLQVSDWVNRVVALCHARHRRIGRLIRRKRATRQSSLFDGTIWDRERTASALPPLESSTAPHPTTVSVGTVRVWSVLVVTP